MRPDARTASATVAPRSTLTWTRSCTSHAAQTTVTITIREVRNYVPAAAPTFATRIARRFQGSLDALRDFLGNLILDFVSILPWLLKGVYVPDIITILASLYFILGDIDR